MYQSCRKGNHYRKQTVTCQSYVKNYPKKSANVYDRMGDYYVAVNDKPKAIEFFSKAHRIQENESSRKKLDDLKK